MAAPATPRKSSSRKATKRTAAPRKAAKKAAARTDDGTNSEDIPVANGMVPSSSEIDPDTNGEAPKANAAVSFVTYDDPYPEELQRFTYWPKGAAAEMVGTDPIIVPAFTTIKTSKHFIWKTRKDPMQQDNMWMDLAAIPDRIQERIVLMPDEDYREFWRLWIAHDVTPNPTPMPDAQVAGSQIPIGTPGESSP